MGRRGKKACRGRGALRSGAADTKGVAHRQRARHRRARRGHLSSASSTPPRAAGRASTRPLSTAETFLDDSSTSTPSRSTPTSTPSPAMATGHFSTQAGQFFNSSIRTQLEQALAESGGQVRADYVQCETPTAATVYAVIDQLYVNFKITRPRPMWSASSSTSRTSVYLEVANVTVLEGASPGSAGHGVGFSRLERPGHSSPARRHGPGPPEPVRQGRRAGHPLVSRWAACGSVVESRGQSQAKRPT